MYDYKKEMRKKKYMKEKALLFVPSDYMEIAPEKFIALNIKDALSYQYNVEIIPIEIVQKKRIKPSYSIAIRRLLDSYKSDNVKLYVAQTSVVSNYMISVLGNQKKSQAYCYIGDCNMRMGWIPLNYVTIKNGTFFKRNLRKIVYCYREKRSLDYYKRCMYITSVDNEVSKMYLGEYAHKRKVIRYGINIPEVMSEKRIFAEYSSKLKMGFLSTFTATTLDQYFKEFLPDYLNNVFPNNLQDRLIIAGRNIVDEHRNYFAKYPFVSVLGEVASLDDFYNDVDIIITTCRGQGGILTKILEAFSYGKCVVGLNTNFESIDGAQNGKHYIGFSKVSELKTVLKQIKEGIIDINLVGQNARTFVTENFQTDDMQQDIRSAIFDE